MTRFEKLVQEKAEQGAIIGPLLPANWIELKGNFTVGELKTIATEVEKHYKKVKKKS